VKDYNNWHTSSNKFIIRYIQTYICTSVTIIMYKMLVVVTYNYVSDTLKKGHPAKRWHHLKKRIKRQLFNLNWTSKFDKNPSKRRPLLLSCFRKPFFCFFPFHLFLYSMKRDLCIDSFAHLLCFNRKGTIIRLTSSDKKVPNPNKYFFFSGFIIFSFFPSSFFWKGYFDR